MEPRWIHDCTRCQFVGSLGYVDDDVYICDNGTMIEVVIRHSDDGSDYWSGSIMKKKEV